MSAEIHPCLISLSKILLIFLLPALLPLSIREKSLMIEHYRGHDVTWNNWLRDFELRTSRLQNNLWVLWFIEVFPCIVVPDKVAPFDFSFSLTLQTQKADQHSEGELTHPPKLVFQKERVKCCIFFPANILTDPSLICLLYSIQPPLQKTLEVLSKI